MVKGEQWINGSSKIIATLLYLIEVRADLQTSVEICFKKNGKFIFSLLGRFWT